MTVILFFIVLWYSSLFCQSFFQHRYAAHGAFTMSKGWERFFFVLTYVTQGSHYLSPRAYGIMHRMHHAETDTELDPHSPSYSSNIFSMMWRTRQIYVDIVNGKIKVDEKYKKNLPEWKWFDKWADSTVSRLLWIGLYVAFFVMFATAWWQYLFLPLIIVLAAFHGAIINWFAHKYGYRNFFMKNTSKNLLPVDVLMWGESYHNNHHKYPSSINFGVRKHEFDPMYPIILFLDKVGVINVPKLAVVKSNEKEQKKVA